MGEVRKPAKGARRPRRRPTSTRRPQNGPSPRSGDHDARAVACEALARQFKRFPDLALDDLDTSGLDAKDAALARAIVASASRRWLTLWGLVRPMLDREPRSLDVRAAAAIMSGAAQIVLLERVPPHAACDESVAWVKRHAGEGKARLVNAILRRLCRLVLDETGAKVFREAPSDRRDEIPLGDGRALALNEEALPSDPLERLSVASSAPVDLLRHWVKLFSMREARRLAMHGVLEPPIILNTRHAEGALPEGLVPHDMPGHHVFTGPIAELASILSARSDLWVQDPASSLAVEGVGDLEPRVVVDLCAGKGTKTRQLARAFPGARIIATDIDAPRARVLRETFAQTPVEVIDYANVDDLAGQADLVLLDVPCSNTGVLGRRVEAKYRFDASRTRSLIKAQRQIIVKAIPLLSKEAGSRGGLLYSTCSLDQQENEEQAQWVDRWHALAKDREHRRGVSGQPGDPASRYSDGSYAALLR